MDVECTTSPEAKFGLVHPVTVQHDWTVSTPHDLDAERLGVALGGYSSCARLADAAVPACRHIMSVLSQTTALERDDAGGWLNTSANGCVGPHRHETLEAALEHEANVTHVARLYSIRAHLFEPMLMAIQAAWVSSADPALVSGGRAGYERLWRFAVHPHLAQRWARRLPRNTWPLPTRAITAGVHSNANQDLARTLIEIFPTPDFAEWVANQANQGPLPEIASLSMLRDAGLDAGTALHALTNGVDPTRITKLADEQNITIGSAARWLAIWGAAGCTPDSAHYQLLRDARLLHVVPKDTQLSDVYIRALAVSQTPLSRADIGVMLALEPNPTKVLAEIQRGIDKPTYPSYSAYNSSRGNPP